MRNRELNSVYEDDYDDSYDEYPDDDYAGYDDDESETIPCSECGAEIHEDAVQCPVCGHYVTRSTSPWDDKPVWWVILGTAGVFATLLALLLIG